MKIDIEKLADRLDNADAPYCEGASSVNSQLSDDISEAADALRAMSKLLRECHAAGFISDEGNVVEITGKLAKTKDGVIIGHGGTVYRIEEHNWRDGPGVFESKTEIEASWENSQFDAHWASMRLAADEWERRQACRKAAEAARGEK